MTEFCDSFSKEVWHTTYRHHTDSTVDNTLRRVAKAIASVEKTPELQQEWEERFYDMMSDFKVIPGGRILVNAGTEWTGTTLINCVSAETLIHTIDGFQKAETLAGKTIKVLSQGGIYRDSTWKCYGEQQLWKITLENGDVLFATEGHDWVVTKGSGGTEKVKTHSLLGRRIPYQGVKKIEISNEKDFKNGIRNGLVYGDGSLYNNHKFSGIRQFGDSKHLIEDYFEWFSYSNYDDEECDFVYANHLPPVWKSIPDLSKSKSYLAGFIAGVIAADGNIDNRGTGSISQASKQDLEKIRLIANQIGLIVTAPRISREKSPFTGNLCPLWTIGLVKDSLYENQHLILKNKHKDYIQNCKLPNGNRLTVRVINVEPTDRFEDVYCCVEPVTHTMVIGNNYLTGQCFVGDRVQQNADSIDGIYAHLLMQAKTLKSEGGWGENFSYIRPRGSFISGIGVESPGAVKFMELFDKSSEIVTLGSGKTPKNAKAKGKIRKGAQMAVLNCTHPDIVEFITAKQTPGRLTKFNMSVNCTDEFMNKLDRVSHLKEMGASQEEIDLEDTWILKFPDTTHPNYNDNWDGNIDTWEKMGLPVVEYQRVSATWLWNLITESTYNRAEPGVLFLDRANHYNPFNYGETIQATNPCLTGDTWIQTANGPQQIKDLIGKPFTITLDGKKWLSDNRGFFFTGHKEIFVLRTSHGYSIKATANHLMPKIRDNGSIEWVELSSLKSGDQLLLVNQRGCNWEGKGTFSDGYLLGHVYGDGYIGNRNITLSIWSRTDNQIDDGNLNVMGTIEEALVPYKPNTTRESWNEIIRANASHPEYRLTTAAGKALSDEYGLNSDKSWNNLLHKTSSEFHKGFLSALFDTDGSVQGDTNGGVTVRLSNTNLILLEECQKMLSRLGITSSIYLRTPEHQKFMPDGKGGMKQYTCRDQYELIISKDNICVFHDVVGFKDSIKMVSLKEKIGSYSKGPYSEKFVTNVESIRYAGFADVYDTSIPGINAFDANGLVVHNCGEQTLAPGNVCCLGSLNLTQFVLPEKQTFDFGRLRKYASYLVRFLDNVNSYSEAPLPEYKYSMEMKRRIGCGLMGWGSALLMMKVRFGSSKAREIQQELMKIFSHTVYEASIDLAEEKGMFPLCNPQLHASNAFVQKLGLPQATLERMSKIGIRNSSLMSIQPNGNSSIFANIVSGGIEPIFNPEYIRTAIVGTVPAEIEAYTPKWYEGQFHETELFKMSYEGDDEILKATMPDGTVYKIDKNRGLTKEVECCDFGVRYLKSQGTWDPNAEWAACAQNLSVDDHINDLQGFARWIDSAISKTINVPHDMPYGDFQEVYRSAYRTGFIKGVTTYRTGTMAAVLSAKDEKTVPQNFDEEVILDSVKMSSNAPATMKVLKAEGRKWYLTVVMNEANNRPFALFVHTNNSEKNVITSNTVDILLDLAEAKGIPSQFIEDTKQKIKHDTNVTKIARVISLLLRHGVLIRNIVNSLDKVENVFVGSFVFQIKKYLSSYIKDGEKVEGEKCENCGSSNIVFSEGCKKCGDCGSSKCG